MAFVLTAVGVLGVLAGVVAWAMAAFVLAYARGRPTNRALALLLFLEGAGAATGNGLMFLTDDRATAYGIQVVATAIYASLLAVYLRFLSTIDAPITAPLRARGARVALAAYALGAVALVLARPDTFILQMVQPWYAPWDQEPGGTFVLVLLLNALGGLYAMLVSFSLLRRAKDAAAVARDRAKAFLAAFTARDSMFVAGALVFPAIAHAWPESPYADLGFLYAWTASALVLAYVPLLAYGMLKAQLFDVDLRIKRGISKGTLGAIFAAVFFVASQIAQSFLTGAYGWLAGGIAAGLLLFALAPLQRVAERVANAAMPRVEATPEYVAFRKHEVYRQAVLDAASDGVLTARERAVLDGLVKSLDIDPAVARDLERSVVPSTSTP